MFHGSVSHSVSLQRFTAACHQLSGFSLGLGLKVGDPQATRAGPLRVNSGPYHWPVRGPRREVLRVQACAAAPTLRPLPIQCSVSLQRLTVSRVLGCLTALPY